MSVVGSSGEAVYSELHGKYYTQNYNGKLWIASLTSASAIPVAATSATPNFIVWNPASNNQNVIPVSISVGFAAGTGIAGAIGYSYIPNAGSTVATGAAMSAFTAATIRGGVAAKAYAGKVLFGTAATVTGTGNSVPVRWKWSQFSQGAPLTSTAAAYSLIEHFDGSLILPPGAAFYVDASAAIAETVMISLVAYEAPV